MEEKDRFKKSQEAEKKRYRFEMKYSKQLEEARAGSQAAVKEFDQVQLSLFYHYRRKCQLNWSEAWQVSMFKLVWYWESILFGRWR